MWYTRIKGTYILNETEIVDFKIDELSEKAEYMLNALFESLMYSKDYVEFTIIENQEYFK